MQRIGIIDLGSNTVRLVVFGVQKDFGKHLRPREFRVLLNEKEVAGLSAYVDDGLFTDAGIERAADVLEDHLASAKNVGCSEVHVFATAVLRNCANSAQAVEALEHKTGLALDIISGEEEAHLGFVGACIGQDLEQGILVDIGGGSTEFTHIERGRDLMNVSVPQGSVSSYAAAVSRVLPTPDECAAIRAAFEERISEYKCIQATHEAAMYGIGGSVRAVAKMLGRMNGRDKAQKQITPADVDRVLALLEKDPSTFAHLAVKAVPDRLHSVIPGCILLRTLMEAAQAKTLTLCKYGVREGYLSERVLG